MGSEKEKMGRLLNPATLYYFAGWSLGNLINFVEQQTKSFEKKEELITLLRDFYDIRTDIFHNSLSSRVELSSQIDDGLKLGFKIITLIEDITEDEEAKQLKQLYADI